MNKNFLNTLIQNWGASGWLVLFLFLISLVFAMAKPLQSHLIEFFSQNEQVILSVADNKFSRNSPIRQVHKISTQQGIMLEIYGVADDQGNRPLLESVMLPDRHDAYFDIDGRATNLAFRDMDNDGRAEIVAPSYDDDWNPRLNVFSYDNETESLRLLNE